MPIRKRTQAQIDSEKKYQGTEKGIKTQKKANVKYKKKVNAELGTLRIKKTLLEGLRKVEGKNDDERIQRLINNQLTS
jgi:hypothetical protein